MSFYTEYKTMENPGYQCYYCPLSSDFNTVINHSINKHSECILKCKRLLIHPSKGTFVHQTKDFEVRRREEVKSGKRFIVNQEKESVTLRSESDCSPLRKQFKDTPEKTHAAIQHVGSTSLDNMDGIEHMEGTDYLKVVEDEMLKLIQNVISELSHVDKVDGIVNFFKLVDEKRFPLDNIALELFLDVVKWFSVSSTTLMRYHRSSKAFWRL